MIYQQPYEDYERKSYFKWCVPPAAEGLLPDGCPTGAGSAACSATGSSSNHRATEVMLWAEN